jgi:hypothetical protein
METKRGALCKKQQHEREVNANQRFMEEVQVEKNLEIWSGHGQVEGIKEALEAPFLMKRVWSTGNFRQLEAGNVFYKVALLVEVGWCLVPDRRKRKDAQETFGWGQQFLAAC